MKKISIIIPCYNEELGIGNVLHTMPIPKLYKYGYLVETIVVDNNSEDNTVHIAKHKGAKVIHEKQRGKGNALIAGFNSIDPKTDYVVIMDGDNTYKPLEIPRMVEPLEHDFCDIVAGSRLGGKMLNNSLKPLNRMGNWMFTFMVRHYYGVNITDTLTGYFAFKKDVVTQMVPHLTAKDFAIEMEMVIKASRMGYKIASVPITYDKRDGTSKLSAISDGFNILKTYIKFLYWKP